MEWRERDRVVSEEVDAVEEGEAEAEQRPDLHPGGPTSGCSRASPGARYAQSHRALPDTVVVTSRSRLQTTVRNPAAGEGDGMAGGVQVAAGPAEPTP